MRKPFRDYELFEAMRKQLGVEFDYRDDVVVAAPSSVEKLAPLPIELKTQLERALVEIDMEAINNLIEMIRAHDAAAAQALAELARNFQYPQILAMLQDAPSKTN